MTKLSWGYDSHMSAWIKKNLLYVLLNIVKYWKNWVWKYFAILH